MKACHALRHRGGTSTRARRRAAVLGAMLMVCGSAVQAEPPALLARAELEPVRSFLARSSGPQPGSTAVLELRRADLDADGREELVVLWGLFGAASAWPSVTVFRQGPQGWREAGTQDIAGWVERLDVRGREILLELRQPQADELHHGPGRDASSRYYWDGRRLVVAH